MIAKQPLENQNKKVEYDNIIYSIDVLSNTACAVGYKGYLINANIPSSIKEDSNEYYITSISKDSFKQSRVKTVEFPFDSKLQIIDKLSFSDSIIRSITIPSSVTLIGEYAFNCCRQLDQIEFPSDSKLQIIDKCAFSNTAIKSIKIPSSVTLIGGSSFYNCKRLEQVEIQNDSKLQIIGEYAFGYTAIKSFTIPSELIDLKEGWFNNTQKLTKIEVSPKNQRYRLYEDKMIIGKSNIDKNNYDCLVFCIRNIKHITIPNFIENIGSHMFYGCNCLEQIEFQSDSKLKKIDEHTFSFSAIKSIKIPSSVTSIGKNAFYNCKRLEQVEIQNDSKLQIIGEYAFSSTAIKSFTIPSELIDLNEGWCDGIRELTNIEVSPKNQRYRLYEDKMIIGKSNIDQNNYDCLVFCIRNIKHIIIPNYIENICSYSFQNCHYFEQIEFQSDSKLKKIDEHAFMTTAIKSIKIPSSVTLIKKNAFYFCKRLEQILIQNDSKLQTIEKGAFSYSAIKSISIPSSIKLIEEDAFCGCNHLLIVEINNSKMISMCLKAFANCENALIMIPFNSLIFNSYE